MDEIKRFDYLAPTEITFDVGRVTEAGVLAARYGKKAILVAVPEFPAVAELYIKAKKNLADAGVAYMHYDGVIPNSTTELVTKGAELAKAEGVDVVIGLDDGSSMDTAEAIAVEATHPGIAWSYNYHTIGPTEQTLPILTISTTADTGSQITPCAVITKTSVKDRSAIWSKNVFPRAAIVDPRVTLSLPANATAQTGFDVFYHNFEAYLSVNTNPLVKCMALDTIRIIATCLPRVLAGGSGLEARSRIAWADTLGGLTNVSAGVTLSHGLGVQVGDHCPHVTRGQPLAVFHPAFTRYTYPAAEHRFATVGRISEPSPEWESGTVTVGRSYDVIDCFPKRIGLWINFRELDMTEENIREITDYGQVLGDYVNNPRVATIPEMHKLFMSCYDCKQGEDGIITETGILNRGIAAELARIGYTDRLLIADAGLAIPDSTRVIDLSLVENVPAAVGMLKELLKHFSVRGIILSQATLDVSPSHKREFRACFPPELPYQVVSHPHFWDELTRQVEFAIRTRDFTTSSNIILINAGNPRWYCEKSWEGKGILQQVMTAPGIIEFREAPIPESEAGEVLVKIMRIGTCGSGIRVYRDGHPFTEYPVTQGHEISGEITALGKGVTSLRVGQRVTIEPQVVCGRCYPCRRGKYNLCEELKVMGFQTTSIASEFSAVNTAKITPLPDTMSFNEGAMIEPLVVVVHAAERFPELAGAKVAILGSGPIGILLAQSCKALGAAQMLITDISDIRLGLSRSCGADFAVNTRTRNFGKVMVECFGPDKADVIYDCAGSDTTMGQIIQYAHKSNKLVLVAIYTGIAYADLALLSDHELDLDSTMMYRHEDYVDAIRLVNERRIRLKPLMSRHFTFGDHQKAYQYIDVNREVTTKILIDVAPCEE